MGREIEVEKCYAQESNGSNEDAKIEIEDAKITSYMSSAEIHQKVNCCDDKLLLAKTVASGQVLSLMLCSTGTAATALSTIHNIRTPCFNAFLMYALLALTFGVHTLRSKNFIPLVKKHGWKYLLVAILDVEGNYLLTKAYAYTTLTSVQLCDSFTIPTVMIISFIFLRVRYKIIHYVGVVLCISGAVCLMLTDGGGEKANAPNEIVGDVIALSAAVFYGISQVGQEYLVKKYSWTEYLGMIGLFGVCISGMQVLIIERNLVRSISWTWQIGLIFAAFGLCQYLYYTIMPFVMRLSSATVVNLSLLTSDLYTLIVGLFLFGYKFSYIYFVAFAGIFIGLITYNIKPTPTAPPRQKQKSKIDLNYNKDDYNEIATISKFEKLKWYHAIFKPHNSKIKFVNRDHDKTPLANKNNDFTYTRL